MPAELHDAFYPILLSRIEPPVSRGDAELYFEKLVTLADQGIRTGRKHAIISISDVTKFTAASRKQVAEAQARYLTAERDDVTLAAFVPIDNSLLRGGITALRWIAPRLTRHIHVVASREAALDEALRALAENGTPFTGDLRALRKALDLTG